MQKSNWIFVNKKRAKHCRNPLTFGKIEYKEEMSDNQTNQATSAMQMLETFAQVPKLVATVERLNSVVEQQNTRIDALTRQCREVLGGVNNKLKFYRVGEVAERLNICHESVRRLVRRGILSKSNGFRTLLIPVEDVENYLRATK